MEENNTSFQSTPDRPNSQREVQRYEDNVQVQSQTNQPASPLEGPRSPHAEGLKGVRLPRPLKL
eukprot:CAMPEP_0117752868 /NCGR_PEP_ID=MMETSP0947-20121206/11881_1 /TAXON_ID=44440 /ORGANISM="Chattonella subsalsa, Strain CCMP2191" /LENGTH=63 /DNA_ID=CAMNT_0005571631 /DNA_START=206 /DNA_END=397 /DNA_ORIENTATION=+